MPVFTPYYGTVMSITPMNRADQSIDGCSLLFSLNTDSGPVNFVVTGKTYVVDQETLKAGDRIVVFYDSSLPVPLIYPPQYQAVLMAELDDSSYAAFDYFDTQLINQDRTLRLNLSSQDRESVVLANGQTFYGNPGGHYLLVLYTTTTRSIPAMTTPEQVVVFCNAGS